MARGAGVACRTREDATRHARPCGRATRAHAVQGGADVWQGPHKSTRTPMRGATWREGGMACEGPTS